MFGSLDARTNVRRSKSVEMHILCGLLSHSGQNHFFSAISANSTSVHYQLFYHIPIGRAETFIQRFFVFLSDSRDMAKKPDFSMGKCTFLENHHFP